MEQFSYSFAVSMMHSVWQSAILLGLYFMIITIMRSPHPLFKRNLLYGSIAVQLICSVTTFYFYSSGSFTALQNSVSNLIARLVLQKEWLQQYAVWIFCCYTMIILFKIFKNIFHWLRFKNGYKAGLVKPSADIKIFTATKAYHFGIKKKVSLWYSTTIHTPVVFGFLKPVILLPVALVNQLSVAETEALIIHELTHIRYNDYLLNWLLVVMETVYFFNPFIRIIAGKIKMEREKNCDVQVLQFQYNSISYADALLKTAKYNYQVKTFQLAAVFNRSQLLTRIRFFSVEENISKRHRNSLPFSFASFLLILIVTVSLLAKPLQKIQTNIVSQQPSVLIDVKPSPVKGSIAKTSIENPVIISENNFVAHAAKVKRNTDQKIISTNDDRLVAVNVENIPVSAVQKINIIPVSYTDQPDAINEGKQVVIHEESSTGKAITKVYNVKLENGKWISEPIVIFTESKPTDTLHKKAVGDSTVWKVVADPVGQ